MERHKKVSEALRHAGHLTAARETHRLRRHAADTGWPDEATKSLQVHYDDGEMHATFDGAEDWEYGTQGRPPLAVARTFELHLNHSADEHFLNQVNDLLGGLL